MGASTILEKVALQVGRKRGKFKSVELYLWGWYKGWG
jgi:hypothetical protein